MFLLVVKRLAVYSSKNHYSFQSAANLNIFQNIFKNISLKIVPSKNCSLKKCISKSFFKKFLQEKRLLEICSLKKYISNDFLKKYISRFAPSKNTFPKVFLKNCSLKKHIPKKFFKKLVLQN